MTGGLRAQHPRWPSYFDPDILVYDEDWEINAEQRLLLLGSGDRLPPQRVQLLSITRLPDQLLFLNGEYLPDEFTSSMDDASSKVPETYYGICGIAQFAQRAPALLSEFLHNAG